MGSKSNSVSSFKKLVIMMKCHTVPILSTYILCKNIIKNIFYRCFHKINQIEPVLSLCLNYISGSRIFYDTYFFCRQMKFFIYKKHEHNFLRGLSI